MTLTYMEGVEGGEGGSHVIGQEGGVACQAEQWVQSVGQEHTELVEQGLGQGESLLRMYLCVCDKINFNY